MVESNYLQSRSIREMVLWSGVISVASPAMEVVIVNVSTGSLSSSSVIVVFRHILVSEMELKMSVADPDPEVPNLTISSNAVDDIQVNFSAHQCLIIAIDLLAVPNDSNKETAMGFAAAGCSFSTMHDSMNPSVSVYTSPPGSTRLTSIPSINCIQFL